MEAAAENPPEKAEKESSKSKKKPTGPVVIPKTTYDVQRLKLERLFANPDKPVVIPTPATKGSSKKPHDAPEFVRNVMGSSAGAGSGEFHVYRHLRRKEYARQKYIERQAKEEQLDAEYKQRLEENKRKAEERTAKKRAKRLKRKQNMKKGKKGGKVEEKKNDSEDESEDSDDKEDSSAQENVHDDKDEAKDSAGDTSDANIEGSVQAVDVKVDSDSCTGDCDTAEDSAGAQPR
ncbi:PRKR-interacting protein 1 homolog [Ornithodoros turicata]|uniref:PRKR-interacting protein 1 homolog n=1 Tax=Ornithodoros turicata TaxID=34597 RepID=UPI0031394259